MYIYCSGLYFQNNYVVYWTLVLTKIITLKIQPIAVKVCVNSKWQLSFSLKLFFFAKNETFCRCLCFSLLLYLLPIQNVRILKAHNVSHRLQPLVFLSLLLRGDSSSGLPKTNKTIPISENCSFSRFKILTKKLVGIGSQKVSHLVSISPTFYEQLFHTKVFWAAFLYLRLRFVFFWQKDIGAKAARKIDSCSAKKVVCHEKKEF